MFGKTFKQFPAKYIYGGFCVRKSYTVMTNVVDDKVVYNTFLNTYVDNFLTYFILMDNGLYKNYKLDIEVPEVNAEDLMSKHIARGRMTEFDEDYNKEEVIGVFGLRSIEDIVKKIDEMRKQDTDSDVSFQTYIDIKSQYMGVEIDNIFNSYNNLLKYDKGQITVPPVKGSMDDDYPSVIGDELDYFDFMSNKDSDQIIKDLKQLSENIDGVGNVKTGKEVTITKGDENTASTLEIKDVQEENTRGTLDMGSVTDVK